MAGKEVDLTGQRFGQLYVHSLKGLVTHGRNRIKVWACVCDCGEKLTCRHDDLRKGIIPACDICRRGPCTVCGKAITNKAYSVKRNTCSDECANKQRRARDRKRYYKIIKENPEHNKVKHVERITKDPDYNKKRYKRKIALRCMLPEPEAVEKGFQK